MRVLLDHDRCTLLTGDAIDLGEVLAPESVDSIVCDPPAGIAFMSKQWDGDKGGRNQWIDWLTRTLTPAYAALKPGGFGFCWSLPRTQHWTMFAIENLGAEIRDVVNHVFGSGFPKSLNISKAIDEKLGAERTVLGTLDHRGGSQMAAMSKDNHEDTAHWANGDGWTGEVLGGPVTDEAKIWNGWGTALKPAYEPWIMFRKPLRGTVVQNVLTYGVGGINIDGCRIGSGEDRSQGGPRPADRGDGWGMRDGGARPGGGRWPSHLIISHTDDCILLGVEDEKVIQCGAEGKALGEMTVQVERYQCSPECPAAILDAQGGIRKSGARSSKHVIADIDSQPSKGAERGRKFTDAPANSGPVSRYFYCAKPAKKETEAGLAHLPARTGGEATGGREDGSAGLNSPRAGAGRTGGRRNTHPTKKSIALMRYLVRLVTPPGGIVLDPFAGSGTTGLAALAEGMSFVGNELGGDPTSENPEERYEYLPILVGRVRHALSLPPEMYADTLAPLVAADADEARQRADAQQLAEANAQGYPLDPGEACGAPAR